MRAILPFTAVSALALATLTGCAVVPAGPTVSRDVDIDAATSVVLDTFGDVTITEGEPALTVHARSGVLDLLTFEVRDGALVLGNRPGPMPFSVGEVRFELSLPSVERVELNGSGDVDSTVSGGDLEIDLSGSGDIEFEGIAAELVEVDISGSGDVSLHGTTSEQVITIDGSGDVDSEDLDSERATVSIDGSGEVRVHVTGTLDAAIAGSGSVRYSGSPEVQSDVSGSGEIVED